MRLAAFLVACLLPCVAHAQVTILVPGDAPTIQAGIALAQDGDTVLVQPGVYAESIDLDGKTIEVLAAGGPATTTIDATGLGSPVITIGAGSQAGTRVTGFTITGGDGSGGPGGGGVRISDGAEAELLRCVITGNDAGPFPGGGVWCDLATATLTDCRLVGNTAAGGGGAATLPVDSVMTLTGCEVSNNVAGSGGGLAGAGITAIDCVLQGNVADTTDGGGALGVASLQRCLFLGNAAAGSGGGYFEQKTISGFVADGIAISDCVFLDNTAGGEGGGLYLEADSAFFFAPENSLTRVVCAGNTAAGLGDGLRSYASSFKSAGTHVITNCTFEGDDVVATGGPLTVVNTVARNTPAPFSASSVSITYSNVSPLPAGLGNFDLDPQYVDAAGDGYCLRPTSPNIDRGDPASPLDPDGSQADVGAIALSPFCDLDEALYGSDGFPTLAGAGTLAGGTPVTVTLSKGLATGSAALVFGAATVNAPIKGGVLVPTPTLLILGIPVDPNGQVVLQKTWPAGLPSGLSFYVQYWMQDPVGPAGWSASNGLALTNP